jgi:lysozyme
MAASAAARMSGIDVSHFQQDIDWQQVRRVGISFAFIKATEGVSVFDPLFIQNWRKAEMASVLRGAYHFFRPQLDAEAQARFFLGKLKGGPGELPPVLDVEALTTGTTPDQLLAGARTWLEVVKKSLGCQPILYTGSAFWRKTLKNSSKFADYRLWIAHYTSKPNPALPAAWPKWTFWQFSQVGKVAGISGNVDLDIFNGTASELEAMCIQKPKPVRKTTALKASIAV